MNVTQQMQVYDWTHYITLILLFLDSMILYKLVYVLILQTLVLLVFMIY